MLLVAEGDAGFDAGFDELKLLHAMEEIRTDRVMENLALHGKTMRTHFH